LVRLHVVVEGQTEEAFMRDILAPILGERAIFADVHCVTTGRKHSETYRGGLVRYHHLRRDLTLWMRQDQRPESWFTTMVDLYRLPSDFPGLQESRAIADPIARVKFLESRLASDLNHHRFTPYIQLHEFEALLFSDPKIFSVAFPENTDAIAELVSIRRAAISPEHIDDGVETSPSRRICAVLPQYAKASSGPIIARAIGLNRICQECTHFNSWVQRLYELR
jgi:uncharacterized protein DUF4276